MKDWHKTLDEIDRDCVRQYERFLGRKLKSKTEYIEIDSEVEEMILDFDSAEEFFAEYPKLKKYKN